MFREKSNTGQEEFQMDFNINNKICPFVQKPFSHCYCFSLTSRDIDSAIYYCSNNFEICDIFRKNYPEGKGLREKQKS